MTKKETVNGRIISQSEVIKNPNRKLNTVKRTEPYQPEYSRLGLEPTPPAHISPEEFAYGKKKRRVTVVAEPSVPPALKTEPAARKLPETSVKVQSGRSRDHYWYPSEQDSLEKAEQFAHAEIAYDEVGVPDEVMLEEEELEEEDSEPEFDMLPAEIQQLPPGHYCLCVDNKIICTAFSLDEVEELIESLIFNPDSPYHGMSVEEIAVLQRLELKFGISIKK
jgi:hypothetical protein